MQKPAQAEFDPVSQPFTDNVRITNSSLRAFRPTWLLTSPGSDARTNLGGRQGISMPMESFWNGHLVASRLADMISDVQQGNVKIVFSPSIPASVLGAVLSVQGYSAYLSNISSDSAVQAALQSGNFNQLIAAVSNYTGNLS